MALDTSADHPHEAIREAWALMQKVAEDLPDGVDITVCDRCNTHKLLVRSAQVSRDTNEAAYLDVRLKCPSDDGCGWWTRHGIAKPYVGEQLVQRWRDEWNGHVDAVETHTPGSDVEERLEALGYLPE